MKNSMRDVILNQPKQITHSLDVNSNVKIEGDFDEIILAGMGGSGHPGDLLNGLHLPKVPLIVHRTYDLPKTYGKKPLVIVSSYSGNTEEALSVYKAAQVEKIPILASTSGGTLADWCKRDGTPMALIDFPDMQPRHTLFAAFVGLATALKNSGLAQDISSDLKRTANNLKKDIPTLEKAGKSLAKKLKGKTPIYTSSHLLSFAAQNFKIQTNENSKTPAFWNYFPELNHNELVGFTKPQAKFHVVILRDKDDHPRTRARMDVTAELYEKWGVEVSTFEVKGKTLLEKMLYTISFGFWTTYYLALAYDIDPIPVEGVEAFKAKLKEVAGDS
jgi:glucose/mannose-6-phosphate isomerase